MCLTSHRQRGHLETAPPFAVPSEGHEVCVHHQLLFVMLRRCRLYRVRDSASTVVGDLSQGSLELASSRNHPCYRLPGIIGAGLSLRSFGHGFQRFRTTHFHDVIDDRSMLPTIDVDPHRQIVRGDADLSPRLGVHRRGDLSQGSLELASSRNHPCYRHAGILGADLSLRSFGHGFPRECIAFGVVTSPRNHQCSLHPGVIRSKRLLSIWRPIPPSCSGVSPRIRLPRESGGRPPLPQAG